MTNENLALFAFLNKLRARQLLRNIDVTFSQWLLSQLPKSSPTQLFLAAIVSYDLGDGHVCVALDDLSLIIDHWPKALQFQAQQYLSVNLPINSSAGANDFVDQKIIGDGQVITPLVLDNKRLYLYRYWRYECHVANRLIATQQGMKTLDPLKLKVQLDKYFISDEDPDWQRVAAAITTSHQISVISGGPGTGKTTTVTKLLAIYIESQLSLNRSPIIQLAAPTGKAAARLSESIALAKSELGLSSKVLSLIPEQGQTLHRLLGSRLNKKKFIHNQDNLLLLDLLVIDEASMIDLPMMASIMSALSRQTRLILIGDKDQLASVEAGSVLGDICAVPKIACYSQQQTQYLKQTCGFANTQYSDYGFSDRIAFLQKSYRFSAGSGIGALAKACNTGDTEIIDVLFNQGFKDLQLIQPCEKKEQILEQILVGYSNYLEIMREAHRCEYQVSAEQLLNSFTQFQVLCALRVGDYGVDTANQMIEQYFEKTGIKEPDNRWYLGRPIMITRNDSQMQLYNGDVGVTCYDNETKQMKVWFEQSGELRAVLPSRLPQHETVFAMTVHKSQGSEFSHVMLLLAQSAKVVNRELIYTAVTRAKTKFSFFGYPNILKQAIKHTTRRTSGLADKIWSNDNT